MGASRVSSVRELELTASSVRDTLAIAAAVARAAADGDLIGLVGELGAGKTQFVRGLAEGLGIDPDHISSPTFVLMHEYEPREPDRPVLVHIDAYRLRGADELATIGWHGSGEELRQGAVVAVEWANRVSEAMGEHWLEIVLEHAEDAADGPGESRRITLRPHGDWANKINEVARLLDNP